MHLLFDVGASGHGRMSLIQTLRRYFTGVIDTHEPCRMASLRLAEICLGFFAGRIWPRRVAGRRDDGP